jgi:hypothetical protein
MLLTKGALAARAAGAASLYLFDAEECRTSSFSESSSPLFGNFTRGSATSCLNMNGVGVTVAKSDSSVQMISASNATKLNSQIAGTAGLSIEMWLKHSTYNASAAQTILSLSSLDSNVSTCSEGSSFEVTRIANKYAINLRAYNASKLQCTTLQDITTTSVVNGEGPIHVVITLNFTAQMVRIHRQGGTNNVQGGSNTRMRTSAPINFNDTSLWNSSFYLQAFGNTRSTRTPTAGTDVEIAPWAGELYLTALYTRVLNDSEIYSNYLAGLTNSPPAVFDANITIPEDGEFGDHYSTPAYYLSEVPFSDLINISLPAPYDAELDSSKAHQYDPTSRPPSVYISTLPQADRGRLYLTDGSTMSTLPHQLAAPYNLKFRPVKDEYSSTVDTSFASFQYYAIDGETFKRSATDATVNLFVSKKNDPPLPVNGVYDVQAGSDHRLVCVTGTDIDEGDSAVSGRLITSPRFGDLYIVSADGPGTTILTANVSFGSGQLCAAYRYSGVDGTAINGYVASDSFTFAVEDMAGSVSTTGTAILRVRSSLSAKGAYLTTCLCVFISRTVMMPCKSSKSANC